MRGDRGRSARASSQGSPARRVDKLPAIIYGPARAAAATRMPRRHLCTTASRPLLETRRRALPREGDGGGDEQVEAVTFRLARPCLGQVTRGRCWPQRRGKLR